MAWPSSATARARRSGVPESSRASAAASANGGRARPRPFGESSVSRSDSVRPERASPSPSPSATSRLGAPGPLRATVARTRPTSPVRSRAPTTSASGRNRAMPGAAGGEIAVVPQLLEEAGRVGRGRAEHGRSDPRVGRVAPGDRGEAVQRVVTADLAQREGKLEADAQARVVDEPNDRGGQGRRSGQPRLGQKDGVLADVGRSSARAARRSDSSSAPRPSSA